MAHINLIKRILYLPLSIGIVVMILSFGNNTQTDYKHSQTPVYLTITDSTFFSPNTAEGWNQYATGFLMQNDSVVAELVLGRQMTAGMDWNTTTLVGTIAPLYAPVTDQTVKFSEPNRNWYMVIKTDGKCYLRLIGGIPPVGNTIILPARISYKK